VSFAANRKWANTSATVFANYFTARNISLKVQDTMCDDIGGHYFKDCYIEGSIDFIFYGGRSMYKVGQSSHRHRCDCKVPMMFVTAIVVVGEGGVNACVNGGRVCLRDVCRIGSCTWSR
ncbi:hypothetical protein Taro_005683, partial [Colocasia esculenta]|nr:hypothetical protein [Colocasia esculenta]